MFADTQMKQLLEHLFRPLLTTTHSVADGQRTYKSVIAAAFSAKYLAADLFGLTWLTACPFASINEEGPLQIKGMLAWICFLDISLCRTESSDEGGGTRVKVKPCKGSKTKASDQ